MRQSSATVVAHSYETIWKFRILLRPPREGCKLLGPFYGGHSGPLCHALSLLSSLLWWTSMRRWRATVGACNSSDTWWMAMRRLAVAIGPSIFQMLLVVMSMSTRITGNPHFFCVMALDPPVAALRYVKYFRFCGWRHVFTQWAIWRVVCITHNLLFDAH